jgi:hypothetical protein
VSEEGVRDEYKKYSEQSQPHLGQVPLELRGCLLEVLVRVAELALQRHDVVVVHLLPLEHLRLPALALHLEPPGPLVVVVGEGGLRLVDRAHGRPLQALDPLLELRLGPPQSLLRLPPALPLLVQLELRVQHLGRQVGGLRLQRLGPLLAAHLRVRQLLLLSLQPPPAVLQVFHILVVPPPLPRQLDLNGLVLGQRV